MPLYMDRHFFGDAASLEEIKAAHEKDLALQEQYGVKMLTYWYDEARHMGFCLGETGHRDDLIKLHAEAHGQIPNEVIEVQPALVRAFLGDLPEVNGPSETVTEGTPATRTIMFTDLVDFTAHTSRLGDAAAMALLRVHDAIVRGAVGAHGGREVKHTGDGIMASFDGAEEAVFAAAHVQNAMQAHRAEHVDQILHVRVGLASGEPVEEGGDLFGSAVQLASRLCNLAPPDGVLASRDIFAAPGSHRNLLEPRGAFNPKGFDEPIEAYGLAPAPG